MGRLRGFADRPRQQRPRTLLRFGNILLERGLRRVDLRSAMREINTARSDDRGTFGGADSCMLSVLELAHELNSLLDGSLRWVGLSRRALENDPTPEQLGVVTGHLVAAEDAMRQMASMVEAAMCGPASARAVLHGDLAVAEAVPRMVDLHRPMAASRGVTVSGTVDASTPSVPIGLAESIVSNALRNGIEAASRSVTGDRRVEVAISAADDALQVCVRDTGPGVTEPSDGEAWGHGLGLELCRRLAEQLGGTVDLRSVPYGAGAVFTARLPIERLT
jgi:signal transduction histidine kinase